MSTTTQPMIAVRPMSDRHRSGAMRRPSIVGTSGLSARDALPTLAPGSQFGEYRIEEELARGGMGVVYRATRTRTGQAIALKCIAPERSADPEYRKRFEREATVLVRLQHPRIVPLIDWGETDGIMYLALAYLDGPNLETLIDREGPFSLARTIELLAPVAEALDAAHRRGYVHRDVKPANIMLDLEGNVYLTDFGLGKLAASSGLSSTNLAVGTLAYMSPEQFTGKLADPSLSPRTDIYALGCVFYACLTRQDVVPTDTFARAMHAHVNDPPPRLSEVRPSLPAEIDAVEGKALAKDPAARYPTASAFIAAARAVLIAHPGTSPVRPPPPPLPVARRAITEVVVAQAAGQAVGPSGPATVVEPPPTPGTVVDPPPRAAGGFSSVKPAWVAIGAAGVLALTVLGGVFVFGGRSASGTPQPTAITQASTVALPTRPPSPTPTPTPSPPPGAVDDPQLVAGTWPVDAVTTKAWIPAAARTDCDAGTDDTMPGRRVEWKCGLDAIPGFKGTDILIAYYFFDTEAAARRSYKQVLSDNGADYGAGGTCPTTGSENTWSIGDVDRGRLFCTINEDQVQFYQTFWGLPVTTIIYRTDTTFKVLDTAWVDSISALVPDPGTSTPKP